MKRLLLGCGLVVGLVLLLVRPVAADFPPLTPGMYNDNHAQIYKIGTGWTNQVDANAFGGQTSYTLSNTAYFSFTFEGSSITVYYLMCSACSNMILSINQAGCGGGCTTTYNLTANNGSTLYYVSTTVEVGEGIQQVNIIKDGTNASWAIFLDAVYIGPYDVSLEVIVTIPPPEVTVEIVFPEETPPVWRDEYLLDTGQGQRMVAMDYRLSVGEIAIGLLLFAILVVLLMHWALKLLERRNG